MAEKKAVGHPRPGSTTNPHLMQGDAMQTDTPDRILRIKTVLDITHLSRSTMYRKMQNGTFPRNVQISTRCAGWRAPSTV